MVKSLGNTVIGKLFVAKVNRFLNALGFIEKKFISEFILILAQEVFSCPCESEHK